MERDDTSRWEWSNEKGHKLEKKQVVRIKESSYRECLPSLLSSVSSEDVYVTDNFHQKLHSWYINNGDSGGLAVTTRVSLEWWWTVSKTSGQQREREERSGQGRRWATAPLGMASGTFYLPVHELCMPDAQGFIRWGDILPISRVLAELLQVIKISVPKTRFPCQHGRWILRLFDFEASCGWHQPWGLGFPCQAPQHWVFAPTPFHASTWKQSYFPCSRVRSVTQWGSQKSGGGFYRLTTVVKNVTLTFPVTRNLFL